MTGRDLAEAVLLFYSPGPWDDSKRMRWLTLTGQDEATTRVLGDCAREILSEEPEA